MLDHGPLALGTLAALLQVAGYLAYKLGKSKPNVSTWAIWTVMAGLNAATFMQISSVAHALQYIAGTVATFLTFGSMLWERRFGWPNPLDVAVAAICAAGLVVWRLSGDATYANVVLLVAVLLSFVPTVRGVCHDSSREVPLPWVLWTSAYAVQVLNNAIHWNGNPVTVANPLVLFIAHGVLVPLSRRRRGGTKHTGPTATDPDTRAADTGSGTEPRR
jgi:hypothetical protein